MSHGHCRKLADVLERKHNLLAFRHFERLDVELHLVVASDLDLCFLGNGVLEQGGGNECDE